MCHEALLCNARPLKMGGRHVCLMHLFRERKVISNGLFIKGPKHSVVLWAFTARHLDFLKSCSTFKFKEMMLREPFFLLGVENIISSPSICKTSLRHNKLKWREVVFGEYISSCFQKLLKHLLFLPINDQRSSTSDLSGCDTSIAVTWLVNSSFNHQMCL